MYSKCSGCHGADGAGTGGNPPLAGSEWVNGDTETLSQIILNGLGGEITVAGKTYSGVMPSQRQGLGGAKELAFLMTYIRTSFGNNASAVSLEQAKSAFEIADATEGQVNVKILKASHAKMLEGSSISPDTLFDQELLTPIKEDAAE